MRVYVCVQGSTGPARALVIIVCQGRNTVASGPWRDTPASPESTKQAEKLVNTAAVAGTQTLAISERSLSLSLSLCAGSGGSD